MLKRAKGVPVMSDPKTPLCNVWLSLLNGVGVDVKSHGDSTGNPNVS